MTSEGDHAPAADAPPPEHAHCPTCICGRRAPVQGEHDNKGRRTGRGPGTISWAEHEKAWSVYAHRYGGSGQSAQRVAERHGFSYDELQLFLGHDPETWVPLTERR